MMRARPSDREAGAALVLVLGFMLMVGGISAAVAAYITSAINGGTVLTAVRDRQYDADSAIQYSITQVRNKVGTPQVPSPGPGLVLCGSGNSSTYTGYAGPNGNTIRVNCQNLPTLTATGLAQRNVVFQACLDTGIACSDTNNNVIIRAQVNFESPVNETTQPADITHTYVQSWSINQ